jgi:hypothetical protein
MKVSTEVNRERNNRMVQPVTTTQSEQKLFRKNPIQKIDTLQSINLEDSLQSAYLEPETYNLQISDWDSSAYSV